jgi:hypothetical protein
MKNSKFKRFLVRAHFIFSAQLGVDPLKTYGFLKGLPRYLCDLFKFNSLYSGRLELVPCLHDRNEDGGAIKSEYFWQDLLVAQEIFKSRPRRHVDIGSRVDGFIAHVASFRKVEVFDIRPISSKIPGVTFKQLDFMAPLEIEDYCDSISSLHTLEHLGLGRYGDPINPNGWKRGLSNLAQMLHVKGKLYLSVPVGHARVEFNANRIFDPMEIYDAAFKNSLRLKKITIIKGGLIEAVDAVASLRFLNLKDQSYALGIFVFEKVKNT